LFFRQHLHKLLETVKNKYYSAKPVICEIDPDSDKIIARTLNYTYRRLATLQHKYANVRFSAAKLQMGTGQITRLNSAVQRKEELRRKRWKKAICPSMIMLNNAGSPGWENAEKSKKK
jgi:hypothetical protein